MSLPISTLTGSNTIAQLIYNVNQIKTLAANTASTVANSTFQATLANTNSYIATKVNTTTFNSALANTNSYIATKVNTTTFNSALANTNSYIATKVNKTGDTMTGNLTITIGSSGATASTIIDDLVIENSGAAGISILTPNGATGHIAFGDPDDNDVGRFSYAHSTNILNIIAGATSTIGVRAGQVVVAPTGAATGTALGLLHARSASSGVGSVNGGADDIVIENSTTGGLSILTPNTNQGRIAFGDPENNVAAIFSYDHSVDRYYFDINASSKTTIDTTRVIINPGASGGTPFGNGLVIESDTNSILNILSPNTHYGSIFFGDPESSTAGYMQYLHSSNSFVLGSSGIDRVTIDSSGNVGIGTSSPVTTLDVAGTARATQGTPYTTYTANTKTLALTDNGYYTRCSNTTLITITIPNNSTVAFPLGSEMIFFQAGSGNVLFANAAGVTLNSKESLVNLTGQYSAATLKKIATNTWDLIGDLA